MVLGAENKIVCSLTYQNRQVQVTLAFPEQTDTNAEQDFVSRLKMIYLEKIKTWACQTNDLALSSSTTKEKEEEIDRRAEFEILLASSAKCFGMEENGHA